MTGMNSAWGSRAEILKNFGWTYDYLLWGISWLNVSLMLADGARYESEDDNSLNGEPVTKIQLKSKADIKKFINGD